MESNDIIPNFGRVYHEGQEREASLTGRMGAGEELKELGSSWSLGFVNLDQLHGLPEPVCSSALL